MRALSLCSGVGCLDLAASMAGIEIAGQVEIEPFCQQVLAKHWPAVPRLADLYEVQGNEFGTVDLVFGGIPCQPFSEAGQRRGQRDDRYLWPEAFRIIQNAEPTWVLIENVSGMVRMALDDIVTDLAREKYETTAFLLPACAVGAPHQRERLFIVAHTQSDGWRARWTQPEGFRRELRLAGGSKLLADPNGHRRWYRQGEPLFQSRCCEPSNSGLYGEQGYVADSNRIGQQQPSRRISKERRWSGNRDQESAFGLADASSAGLSLRSEWPAWQSQPQPARNVGRETQSRLGRVLDGFADWLDTFRWPARPGEVQEAWEPPRTITERIPHRAARLKALGNGVVPQVAYPIFAAIATIENSEREQAE